MKAKVLILVFLIGTLISLTLLLAKPSDNLKLEQSKNDEQNTLKSLKYVITEVKGNDYYGESIDGKTKLHFNSKNVKYPIKEPLSVNDKILAYVETENHVDGIIKIEKID
jgi:hypothetical protein